MAAEPADTFDTWVELATAYRAKLEMSGFSAEVAEQLAANWLTCVHAAQAQMAVNDAVT